MTTDSSTQPDDLPLRLWPGVLIVALQWTLRFGLPVLLPGATAGMVAVLGALLLGIVLLVWWTFFSRAPRVERWGAPLVIVACMAITPLLLHESVATGMMGLMFVIYAIPVVCLALVLWAVLCRGLSPRPRRLALVAAIVVACGAWTLVRTAGISGGGSSDFEWRWSATAEERLLAEAPPVPSAAPRAGVGDDLEAAWPGFRGPGRDGVVRGISIRTDWEASPPRELWRRGVGPGWSSFAVRGDLFYTQEQRGENETVTAYRLDTGEPVWRHRDPVRFWESNAGAGPRATPTIRDGRVHTFGATGLLNVLDAGDGTPLWSRDTTADTDAKVPIWGFSSSPLVTDDAVIVDSGRLVAYDRESGAVRWLGPEGPGEDYSSPHLMTIDGITQVVLLDSDGAAGVSPEDGSLLWRHEWPGVRIVQPALTEDGDLLIGTGQTGTRRVALERGADGWTTEERWTSNGLKPYFNDYVVHEGHAVGFDGRILAAIDLEDGERRWKGGRYGHGQLLLLADQDLLLVLSEEGDLALVSADADRFTEIARTPAIEGKTWNHPVLVGDLLLVRNDREMAAFRLDLATS